MKMPEIMMAGFTGIPEAEPFITATENKKNTKTVIDDWMLGPEKPSNEPTANKVYWVALGKAMQVDEKEARRRRCSNCEYYDNSPMTQAKMDRIPRNEWDSAEIANGKCPRINLEYKIETFNPNEKWKS